MKIRNGFVSNSSSSSFIIGYQKEKKIVGSEQVLDYILNNDGDITVDLGSCGEGNDVFALDKNKVRTIRRFPKEFLEGISHLTDFKELGNGEWGYVHVEPVAYVDAEMRSNESWYWDSREDQNKVDNKIKEEIKKHIPNAEFDTILVGNNSCSDDWSSLNNFVERYFNTEYSEDYLCMPHSKGWGKIKLSPYGIAHSYCEKDKKKVLDYILDEKKCLKGLIARYNRIYEYVDKLDENYEGTDLDLFMIGDSEKEYIKKHQKEFLNCGDIIYFYNADLITDKSLEEVTVGDRRLSMFFGRASITESNKGMRDFKKIFFEGGDE